jgi:RNA polymerase sigma-70 factor (ECF subfamily)
MDSAFTPQMQNHAAYRILDESDLIDLSQSGDHVAFGELIARHRNSALKVAFSVLREGSDAEDEVQNAFFKAYEHIQQFQREAKFSTWLTRIVVNQCLMRLRQSRRAKLLYIEDAVSGDDPITLELPDLRQSPEQELGREQVARILQQEIHRTPPLLRNVFLLRDVQQRPMPEVAAELGISVAAAKSRLLRARAELRRRMLRHIGQLGAATLTA